MGIHPQETGNNDIVSLEFSFNHLFDHRLNCRAFHVTKESTRTRLNLNLYVFRTLELQFIVLALPSNTCYFNFKHIKQRMVFFFTSHNTCQLLNCGCQLTCIFLFTQVLAYQKWKTCKNFVKHNNQRWALNWKTKADKTSKDIWWSRVLHDLESSIVDNLDMKQLKTKGTLNALVNYIPWLIHGSTFDAIN